jgi:hypothetical protein
MSHRFTRPAVFAAIAAAAAFSLPAHAGVSWSVGINAPIAPGVAVGTVIAGGHVPRYYAPAPVYYAPAPVVYAPPPVYVAPPVVYAPRPVFYPRPVVYGPPVVVAPRPVYRYYRAPVIVRPGHGHHRDGWDHGNPGRGGYEPMSQVHTSRVLR